MTNLCAKMIVKYDLTEFMGVPVTWRERAGIEVNPGSVEGHFIGLPALHPTAEIVFFDACSKRACKLYFIFNQYGYLDLYVSEIWIHIYIYIFI